MPFQSDHYIPTLVSLFSGAGGLDIGLERSGFHTVSANDFDTNCVASLRANQAAEVPVAGEPDRSHFAGTLIVHAPVESLDASDLMPVLWHSGRRLDALVGGPPCQPFSSAGSQRGVHDPRGRLFEQFVRLAEELRPRLILFENVRGLVTARGPEGISGEALHLVRDEFERIGYCTRFSLLNAADYGAPQRRVRLFMLAADEGVTLPTFPLPTHHRPRPGQSLPLDGRFWVTLGEFLADQAPPTPDEIVRPSPQLEAELRGVPDGSGLKSPGRSEPTRPGGHWGYKQGTFVADPSLPARTVTGASTQDWIREPDGNLRRLTLREAAGLQGFPDDWQFCGSRASQFLQIGNAVPIVFGEVLGAAMRQALLTPCHHPQQSHAFPADVWAAIDYANRDDARNGAVRPRSPRFGLHPTASD